MALTVSKIVEGVVSNVMKFGAFISLPEEQSGLVHTPQISDSYVENVEVNHLEKGQTVKVKILSMEDGKIDLSIKQALPKTSKPAVVDFEKTEKDSSFEDKLSKFLKDSNEKYEQARSRQNAKMGTGRS